MDASQLTNWPAIQKFVATYHTDTYDLISPAHVDLSGKSVLVTGASKGIGRQIALRFARAGCSQIAVAARSGSSLAEVEKAIVAAAAEAGRPKPQILAAQADLTVEADVASIASRINAEFGGKLDVLVNNAGRADTFQPITASEPDDFWSAWETNMKSTYLVTRALIPALLKSPTRALINVSSAGANMLTSGAYGYQTTKFALCRFNEFMAREYQSEGLIAIAVHPGDVLTDMTLGVPEQYKNLFVDKPELAGDALVWLSKERREWLNGRFVSVNWDAGQLEAKRDEIVERDLLKFRLTL
ncbi:hypothetical protein SLS62_005516 [Diatrype stigma]|uniref:Ketoreductase domain-containing protein n=1 Tax=Diatrype stigma TaxID=117547 RepID=A0AAN9URH1_9PEZI